MLFQFRKYFQIGFCPLTIIENSTLLTLQINVDKNHKMFRKVRERLPAPPSTPHLIHIRVIIVN